MKFIVEQDLKDFSFWCGAKDTIEDFTDEEFAILEDFFNCDEKIPTETEINDFVWNYKESVYEIVGRDSNGNRKGSCEWALKILKENYSDYPNVIESFMEEVFLEWKFESESELKYDFDDYLIEFSRAKIKEFLNHTFKYCEKEIDDFVEDELDFPSEPISDEELIEQFKNYLEEKSNN